MPMNIAEIPTLEFDVGCYGSVQTDSTKVPVVVIVAAVVASVIATEIVDRMLE
jgi:hypothetical protein